MDRTVKAKFDGILKKHNRVPAPGWGGGGGVKESLKFDLQPSNDRVQGEYIEGPV